MEKLFSSLKIGSITVKNRFMRSPCYMKGCDSNGYPQPWLLKYYKDIADGMMGLIVPEYLYVVRSGRVLPYQGGMETDAQAESWREAVEYMHKKGAKTLFQVGDGGMFTKLKTGVEFRGPSKEGEGSREMTLMEISELIDNFRKAAKRLQNIGVDGIEVHAAHGYLLSSFLSPLVNKRQDRYGGSPENRRKIVREIVDAIRSECGKDFVIGVKINGDDCKPGQNGVTPKDTAATIAAIKDVDLWEISCGFRDGTTTGRSIHRKMSNKYYPFMEGHNIPYVAAVRNSTKAYIAAVGTIRTPETMMKALDAGADLISLGRPTIADTHVVQHILEGKKMKCISCSQCLINIDSEVKCYI